MAELDESLQQVVDANDSSSDDDVLQSPNEPTIRGDGSDLLQRLQENLDSRVKLFWPSMLSSRVVSLELFASQHGPPVGRSEVTTGTNGTFQHQFVIKWDDICDHPLARWNLGEQATDYELILHAKLLPSPASPNAEESKVEEQIIILTHAPTRVISDIDDTIKMSNIVAGARTIFRNVFVRDLKEAVIPGMGEWYYNMWNQGVRFHYVVSSSFRRIPCWF
jgi:phosphatidate phosphatase APP1